MTKLRVGCFWFFPSPVFFEIPEYVFWKLTNIQKFLELVPQTCIQFCSGIPGTYVTQFEAVPYFLHVVCLFLPHLCFSLGSFC